MSMNAGSGGRPSKASQSKIPSRSQTRYFGFAVRPIIRPRKVQNSRQLGRIGKHTETYGGGPGVLAPNSLDQDRGFTAFAVPISESQTTA